MRTRSRASHVSGFLLLGLLALAVSSLSSQAQSFRITKIQNQSGRIVVEHESGPAFYHILSRVQLSGGVATPIHMGQGSGPTGLLVDRTPPASRSYYRVTRIPKDNPLDSDGDGIDDMYELGNSPLNPLNPADASSINPNTGRTRIEDYYRDESNNVLYPYLVGRGMHDVTGPAADGGMMGYAEGDQRSTGIHDRQWARAFVAAGRGANSPRVAFVVVDTGQVFHAITQGVHDRLQADEELRPYYSYANIVLSATHTHGGAGGHSHHVLYNLTIGGFAWQTYDAMVHGI
ncbi:MAG: hypothetical protein FJ405_08140, partial [Verrucomicrobia bacterium]|nr:hypothetical protein [Verrucomicrobiota bacterium]